MSLRRLAADVLTARLGRCREEDLPGGEAPGAFLDWIRARTGPPGRVLEHDRRDVLGLVVLVGVLGKAP